MKTVKNILLATNLSEISALAYDAAIDLANQEHADLHVVVVNEQPSYFSDDAGMLIETRAAIEKHNEQQLSFLKKRLSDLCKAPVHAHLRSGIPAREIVATAQYSDADYIVMAPSGKSALERYAIGSVAEGVLRHAKCPVLCIRSKNKNSFFADDILLATDLSDNSLVATGHAVEFAVKNKTAIHLLHVLEHSSNPTEMFNATADSPQGLQTSDKLNALAERLSKEHNIRVYPIIRVGNPGEEVLDLAKTIGAGLIVMGTHGRRGIARVFLGSVAEMVVKKSTAAVLCVRSMTSPPND